MAGNRNLYWVDKLPASRNLSPVYGTLIIYIKRKWHLRRISAEVSFSETPLAYFFTFTHVSSVDQMIK